jgi:hypothetical protein
MASTFAASHLARVLICAGPLLTMLAPAAAVTTVPAANVLGTVLYNRGDRIDPTTFGHFSVSAGPFGGVDLGMQGEPFPAVQASGQMATDANTALLFGRSVGHLTYHFGIDGPASSEVPVLIDVAGFASGLATPGASFAVLSEWVLTRVSPSGALLATDLVESGQMSGSFAQGFGRTVSLMLDTASTYQIFMRADISVAASDPDSAAEATAFIDPVLRFGAGVDTDQYHFVLSDGIGNPPVPEPPALVLMVLGLGLLAARLRTIGTARA